MRCLYPLSFREVRIVGLYLPLYLCNGVLNGHFRLGVIAWTTKGVHMKISGSAASPHGLSARFLAMFCTVLAFTGGSGPLGPFSCNGGPASGYRTHRRGGARRQGVQRRLLAGRAEGGQRLRPHRPLSPVTRTGRLCLEPQPGGGKRRNCRDARLSFYGCPQAGGPEFSQNPLYPH